jgi:signal peptidase I
MTDKKEKTDQKDRNESGKKALRDLAMRIGVYVLVVILIFTFVLDIKIQYGNNMYPAIRDGELIITNRLAHSDVEAPVIYKHDGKKKIGRIIATSGQVVRISGNGTLLINGVQPAEEIFYKTSKADSTIKYPYTVPSGHVFILNDYRSDMNDSRTYGAISLSDVHGPVLLTIKRRGF